MSVSARRSDIAALMRRFDEAMSAQDADAASRMSPEEVEYVDHRPLGWEPVHGQAALRAHYQSIFDAAADLRVETELVDEDGELVLVRQTAWFQALPHEGGGEGTMAMLTLVTLHDGRFARIEIFDDERDARAAMARAAEGARP